MTLSGIPIHLTRFVVKVAADSSNGLSFRIARLAIQRNRSTRQIPHDGGISVEEGLQLVKQLNQPVEGDKMESHTQGELPSQVNPPRNRAPPKCSGCGEIGHRINRCKNR
jgi:hypothetical protein